MDERHDGNGSEDRDDGRGPNKPNPILVVIWTLVVAGLVLAAPTLARWDPGDGQPQEGTVQTEI